METTTKCVAALGIFSAAVIAGFITGRGTSPRPDAPSTAFVYLAAQGKWTRIDFSHGRIELPVGPKVYRYATGDAAVSDDFIPPEQLVRYKQQINLDNDTEKLIGMVIAPPAEGGLLTIYFKSLSPEAPKTLSKGEVAIVTLLTAGSFGLGYYLGYRTEPDFEEPKFHEALSKNVALWKELDSAYQVLYTKACAARIVADRTDVTRVMKAALARDGLLTLHPEIESQVGKDASCAPSP
jgi:hypothetical protein